MHFSPPLTVRGYLYSSGWRRGSLIELDGNHELISSLPDEHQSKVRNYGYMLLITLYDCALIHNCFDAEPDVGYALVKPIEKIAPVFAKAKNERVLHFLASSGSEEGAFEIRTGGLGFFERSLLLNTIRSSRFETKMSEQQVVGKWISRRVTQPTYPDAFNSRVNKKKKEDLFKKRAEDVSAFYIRISPVGRELAPEEVYKVSIIAAIEESKIRGARKNKLDDTIRAQLKIVLPQTKGIELESFEMMAESQITLGLLREYVQWADEYFSFRNNPYSALPVQVN